MSANGTQDLGFVHTDTRSADLSKARMQGADCRGAKMADCILAYADLRNARFNNADLRRATIDGADLSSADFGGANLEGATVVGATLLGANLRGAVLTGVKLDTAVRQPAAADGGWDRGLLPAVCGPLIKHVAWIQSGGAHGERADLSGCDLHDSDLSGLELCMSCPS
jgi:uncharacterized protein YjbI with pentapeptide repeats